MQGDQWKQVTLQTALLYPGIVFSIFLSLNFLVWGQKSSGAVPFGTLFALCFLWFGISVPLVFVGSYFGYRKPAPEDPVRTNKIPRQIPEQVLPLALRLAVQGSRDSGYRVQVSGFRARAWRSSVQHQGLGYGVQELALKVGWVMVWCLVGWGV